ncbi:MAG: DUF6934 family protein [Emticicia sp.]|uniref:DUF6934 family protein n=1 Tax=Emticicia sp. TaxID=1930953 RepID=UPI003BA3FD0C
MEEPFYDFRILNNALRFEFESVGKRKLKKVILFSDTTIPNLYQLSLADINEDGSLDFLNVSNNNDRNTILATVFQTTSIFFDHYPEALVGFTGSTTERTRLYQITIARELPKLSERFIIRGLKNDMLETFEKNRNYEGFVISLKNTQLSKN